MRSWKRFNSYTLASFLVLLLMWAALSEQAAAQVRTHNPVANAVLQMLEERGLVLTYVGEVKTENDVLSFGGLEGHAQDNPENIFKVSELALAQASLEADGRLFIGALAASNLIMQEPEFEFTTEKFALTDLYIPAEKDLDNPSSDLPFSLYSSAELVNLKFSDESSGHSVPIERISLMNGSNNGDYPFSVDLVVQNAVFERILFAPIAQGWLDQMGKSSASADVLLQGSWDGSTGSLKLENLELILQDIGAITISGELTGLTDTVVEKATELALQQDTLAADLLQGIAVQSFNVSVIDEGGVEPILMRQAQSQGKSQSAFIGGLIKDFDRLVMKIPDKATRMEFAAAFSAFLNNPENLSVTVSPKAAVPFTQIIGVSAISPVSLISLLGITMQANVE